MLHMQDIYYSHIYGGYFLPLPYISGQDKKPYHGVNGIWVTTSFHGGWEIINLQEKLVQKAKKVAFVKMTLLNVLLTSLSSDLLEAFVNCNSAHSLNMLRNNRICNNLITCLSSNNATLKHTTHLSSKWLIRSIGNSAHS